MIPSETLKLILQQHTSGQRNGACASPRETITDLLTHMLADSLANEAARAAKTKPSADQK